MYQTIQRRLVQIRAAEVLADLMLGNPHPLGGDRAGQFAVNVTENVRLVFEPADNPLPVDEQGVLVRDEVRTIRIIEVTDYHD